MRARVSAACPDTFSHSRLAVPAFSSNVFSHPATIIAAPAYRRASRNGSSAHHLRRNVCLTQYWTYIHENDLIRPTTPLRSWHVLRRHVGSCTSESSLRVCSYFNACLWHEHACPRHFVASTGINPSSHTPNAHHACHNPGLKQEECFSPTVDRMHPSS